MSEMEARINSSDVRKYIISVPEFHKPAWNLVNDIKNLLDDLQAHNTVDTLAKKYYLTGKHDKLEQLKKVLIIYFAYEQAFKYGEIRTGVFKELPDKRYDSFIATIIDKKIKSLSLPSNFKIITWNYDRQFEIAYQEYLSSSITDIQNRIQAIPSKEYLEDNSEIDLNKFSLVRLNGVAALNSHISCLLGINPPYSDEDYKNLYNSVILLYTQLTSDDLKAFNYSWEDNNDYKGVHDKIHSIKGIAKDIMAQTDILVIIGYSFPLFNRSVDKELMSSLTYNLQRIYVQDIKDRGTEIKNLLWESFGNLVKNRPANFIKEIGYTNQFFIPPEADI